LGAVCSRSDAHSAGLWLRAEIDKQQDSTSISTRAFQGKLHSLEGIGCIYLVGQYAIFIRKLPGINIDF
jgi:hypothetical protein